jgi:hypothetical protein
MLQFLLEAARLRTAYLTLALGPKRCVPSPRLGFRHTTECQRRGWNRD